MNPEKPPAYSETNAAVPYQQLKNDSFGPNTQGPPQPYSPQSMPYAANPYPPANPYGNMAPTPNQFVFATIQQPQPAVPAATTMVNVNTGPVQKRYCCSCCCTLFWIIVILIIIGGISNAAR